MGARGKQGDARYTSSEWDTLRAAGETRKLGRNVKQDKQDKKEKVERYVRTDLDSSTRIPARATNRNNRDAKVISKKK